MYRNNSASPYSLNPVQIELYGNAYCPLATSFLMRRVSGGGVPLAGTVLHPILTASSVTEHTWLGLPAGTLSQGGAISYVFATATTSNAGLSAGAAGDRSEMGDCIWIDDLFFRGDFDDDSACWLH